MIDMNTRHLRTRVTLIFDRPDWVLGEIALYLKDYLNRRSTRLAIDTCQSPMNYDELLLIESHSDIIHFLSPWDFYHYASLLLRPCVVTVHHLVNTEEFSRTRHHAHAVCVPSKQWYTRLTSESIESGMFLTPYGIDVEEFRPLQEARSLLVSELGCDSETLLLGFAAKRTSDQGSRKGIDLLLELVRMLQHRPYPFLLLLFGLGWDNDWIPSGLRQSIRIMGFIDPSKRSQYYSALDFYVNLSRVEGGPYPVMECMACSTPVISTSVGVVPELICDGVNGFIVSEENYLERIPTIIAQWSEDRIPFHILGERARLSVVSKFDWEKSADPKLYELIYRHAMKKRYASPKVGGAIADLRIRYRSFRRTVTS